MPVNYKDIISHHNYPVDDLDDPKRRFAAIIGRAAGTQTHGLLFTEKPGVIGNMVRVKDLYGKVTEAHARNRQDSVPSDDLLDKYSNALAMAQRTQGMVGCNNQRALHLKDLNHPNYQSY